MRFILAFLFSLSPAIAQQGGGVVQIGAVTANNCVKWVSSNKITDAGATCGGGGGGSGTVTSVGQTFTGGLISVGGSPVTTSGTLALTVAGTSGGVPYFSGAATWASSATLTANALMIGGGAGAAPSTTTTGTGVLTALGSAVNGSGAISLTTNPVFNNPTLRDSNSLNVLTVNAVASAVNYFQMENAAAGGSVHLYAIGTDANIGIHLAPKGTGQVNIQDGTDTTKRIRFDPSGNGTGVITTLASGSTANRTLTLPDLTTTLAGLGLAQTFSAAQTFTSGIISNTLALGGATIGSDALGVTGSVSISGNTVLGSTAQLGWSDAFLTRKGAASIQIGGADAAAPVAQTISAQSVVAGTTNTAGANLTIKGSAGTGTGAGGSILFQYAAAGTTGSAQNAPVTALTLTGAGKLNVGDGAQSFIDTTNGKASFNSVQVTNGSGTNDPWVSIGNNVYLGVVIAGGTGVGFTGATKSTGFPDAVLARQAAAVVKVTDAAGTGAGYIRTQGVTVASLPSAATAGNGARGFVTDATATTFLSIVVGGGSNSVPVVSDGTNWLIG